MESRAISILRQYIDKHFYKGSVKIEAIGDSTVKVTDGKGDSMNLTINIYCDIIDADTKKIYALSNLPHDLDHIGTKLPTDWVELPKK